MRNHHVVWLTLSLLLAGSRPGSGAPDYSARPGVLYLTAKNTSQRLARTGELRFAAGNQAAVQGQAIFIDPSKTFQVVLGIGGALTDAAAETFYKLPKAAPTDCPAHSILTLVL
jgi:glucosylceramidase